MRKPSGKCYPYVSVIIPRREGDMRCEGKTGLSTLTGLAD